MKNNIKTPKTNKSQTLDSFKTIMNPTTGKMVQSGGQLGKKLIKDYKADTIYNPLTKKQVKTGGSVGKKVLSMYRGGAVPASTQAPTQITEVKTEEAPTQINEVKTEEELQQHIDSYTNIKDFVTALQQNEYYFFNNDKKNIESLNRNDQTQKQRKIESLIDNTQQSLKRFSLMLSGDNTHTTINIKNIENFVVYMHFRTMKKFNITTQKSNEYAEPKDCHSTNKETTRNICKVGIVPGMRFFYTHLKNVDKIFNKTSSDTELNDSNFKKLQEKFDKGKILFEKYFATTDRLKAKYKYYTTNYHKQIKYVYELCVRYLIYNIAAEDKDTKYFLYKTLTNGIYAGAENLDEPSSLVGLIFTL